MVFILRVVFFILIAAVTLLEVKIKANKDKDGKFSEKGRKQICLCTRKLKVLLDIFN